MIRFGGRGGGRVTVFGTLRNCDGLDEGIGHLRVITDIVKNYIKLIERAIMSD